jgi:hypothetical protein
LSSRTSHRLSGAEFRLLARAEPGHLFRAPDAEGEVFGDLVERHLKLRERGLPRLEDGRIMKRRPGRVLMAGPYDLTQAGRAALEGDRRLGPLP